MDTNIKVGDTVQSTEDGDIGSVLQIEGNLVFVQGPDCKSLYRSAALRVVVSQTASPTPGVWHEGDPPGGEIGRVVWEGEDGSFGITDPIKFAVWNRVRRYLILPPIPGPELKPCPCCGGEAVVAKLVEQRWVECKACGIRTRALKLEEAVTHWNNRTPAAPPRPGDEPL